MLQENLTQKTKLKNGRLFNTKNTKGFSPCVTIFVNFVLNKKSQLARAGILTQRHGGTKAHFAFACPLAFSTSS